jgi:hypothetical protein
MHTGTKCFGLDGKEYKSLAEKRFVDNYLYNKYEYIYERPYQMYTKYTCDFYVPNLKLWIEIIPQSPETLTFIREIPQIIFLRQEEVDRYISEQNYQWKQFLVKENNMLWDSTDKKWYILREKYSSWKNDDILKKFLYSHRDIVDCKLGGKNKNFESYFERIEKKRIIVEEKYKEFFVSISDEQIGDDPNKTLAGVLYKNMDKKFGWRFFAMMERVSPSNALSLEKIEKTNRLEKVNKDMEKEISVLKEEKKLLETSNNLFAKKIKELENTIVNLNRKKQNQNHTDHAVDTKTEKKMKKYMKNKAKENTSRIQVVRYFENKDKANG